MKKTILLLTLSIIHFVNAHSQTPDPAQYPPDIRWKQIKSPHFTIVVPETNIGEGQRVANIMENMYPVTSKTLKDSAGRYKIILSNQNIVANGYVTLIPRKSEFYTTPIQSGVSGTNEWYYSLAIHEGRHMLQFDKYKYGEPLIWYIFTGNYGLGAYIGFTTPIWLAEGDAVLCETAHSRSGRGRLPSFDMGIRAKLLSGEKYGYYRAYNRSFKDYYPNHYALGYQLVKYGRAEYDNYLWANINESMVYNNDIFPIRFLATGELTYHFTLRPFYKELKKKSGLRVRKFHSDAFKALDSTWRKQLEGLSFTEFNQLSKSPEKGWVNYEMPVYENNQSVIAYKYGLGVSDRFVRINSNGSEELLTEFASNELTRNSYAAGKLCWTEEVPDIRWGNRSYGKVLVFDINKNEKKYLGEKSKYISASLSPIGNMIAAVEMNEQRQCAIVLLDANNGNVLKKLPNPDNDLILCPAWSSDSRLMVFARTGTKGKALTVQHVADGTLYNYMPYSNEDVNYPVFYNNYIVYNSPYSGIDNIYAIDTITRQRFQVTSSKFGAFNPNIDEGSNTMYYSDYAAKGHNAVSTTLNPQQWKPLESIKVPEDNMLEKAIADEPSIDYIDSINTKKQEFPVKDFNKALHSINPYAWKLLPSLSFDDASFHIKSNMYSQDILNNIDIDLGYDYAINHRTSFYNGMVQYKGLFPIFGINVETGQKGYFFEDASTSKKDYLSKTWNESHVNAFMAVPINFSRGIFSRNATFSIGASYNSIKNRPYENQAKTFEYDSYKFTSIQYSFSISNYKRGSYKDLNPPWGQSININFSNSPFKDDDYNQALSAKGELYFPGLFDHHSLLITGSYMKQLDNAMYVDYPFELVRGYLDEKYKDAQIATVNYLLPICYPDLALGGFMYIKRLKGRISYDYGIGNKFIHNDADFVTGIKSFEYQSVGATLFFDFTPLALPPQVLISIGVSTYYRVEDSQTIIAPAFNMRF